MRLLRPGVVAAGTVVSALVVLGLLARPKWFALAVAVLLVGQLLAEAPIRLGRPLFQRIRDEVRAHAAALQAIRGLILVAAAAALGSRLADAVAVFFAVLLAATRLLPPAVTRVTDPRMLVAALPGAQEVQDGLRLFDSVSRTGRAVRARINRWTGGLEVLVVAFVIAADLGLGARAAKWLVIAATVGAAITMVVEASTLVVGALTRANIRFHERVVRALREYEPEYLLYFSAPPSAVYQIRQWLPHLMSSPRRFAIITREDEVVAAIAGMAPGVPVVSAPWLTMLDGLVVPSAKVVLYVNNGMRNTHMLRHRHLRHVQMLHGESDKSPSVNKFARAYDELYVAGQAAVDRYATLGVAVVPSAFTIVGRPQADAVSTAVPTGRTTVLYAPTWEGFSSIRTDSSVGLLGVELVRRLLARGDVRVIVRPHPTTGLASKWVLSEVQAMRALIERAGGDHLWSAADGELSLVDCFNLCHVMIADISSVMADFLRSEKPLVVTDVDGLGAAGMHESYPTTAAAWILDPDAGNIDEILADVMGPDSFRAARRQTRHYVLGDFDGPAEPVFHRALAASIDEHEMTLPAGLDDISE